MNLLIVDDDKYIIEGIMRGISWDEFPFEHIYTAVGYFKAKNILSTVQIDLMLCDIEMPQGSGLDLVEWAKDNGYKGQTVFLTSYAEFKYAQRAISLGSFEYLLKPVTMDRLRDVLLRTIEQIEADERSLRLNTYGRYWLDRRQDIKDSFWHKVISQDGRPEDLGRMSEVPALGYSENDRFLIAFFKMGKDGFSRNFTEKDETARLERKRRLEGIFSVPWLEPECYLEENAACAYVIFKIQPVSEYKQRLCEFADTFIKNFGGSKDGTGVYFSRPAVLAHLGEQLLLIKQMRFNDLYFGGGCHYTQEFGDFSEVLSHSLDTKFLDERFRQKDAGAILSYLKNYLEIMSQSGKLKQEDLKHLMFDMMQMVFSSLKEHGIEAHQLFARVNKEELYIDEIRSGADFLAYMELIVGTAIDYEKYIEVPGKLADRMIAYIDTHLQDNISRETLAKEFYISQDYLSRIFKKATGESIVAYITRKRMEKARGLLLSTELPVYMVAARSGFLNSSYFSKLFRDTFGETPAELRRQLKEEH